MGYGTRYELNWGPRNTEGYRGTCSLAAADRLAKLIRELVPQENT